MRVDHSSRRVYVRQSSLNDMLICPERSRLKTVLPDFNSGSDATIMGTAVHHGIENILGGMDARSASDSALAHFDHLRRTEKYKETNIDPMSYESSIVSMMRAFTECILPEVALGGTAEWRFTAPLGIEVQGYDVFLEGTMDYIDPNGVIWDWKTSSRLYNGKDKQSTSVQATVYAHAAVSNMLAEYPVDFRYGVMVRQSQPKAQVVYLERSSAHSDWLIHQIEPYIRYALTVGLDHAWMRNDTGTLCSDRWCSHWSVCKGAYISPHELALPRFPVSTTVDIGGNEDEQ